MGPGDAEPWRDEFPRFDVNMAGIRMGGYPRRDDHTLSTRSARMENAAGVTLLALF